MVEDLGAPESWEVADLDESMSRLMLSSGKDSKPHELADVSASASSFSSSASDSSFSAAAGGVGEKVSDDAINQVDQFLREAIQNPRERLSSKLYVLYVNFYAIYMGRINNVFIDSKFVSYLRLFLCSLD